MLAHVVGCLPEPEARIIWESALRTGSITVGELQRIPWRSPAARLLGTTSSPRSDSLLETLLLHRFLALGLRVEQQARLSGHRVDFLVERRVVVQVDGFQHHQAGQRRSDIEHDAWLQLQGMRVLRFGYGDVIDRPDHVIQLVLRTLAVADTEAIAG